MKRTIEPLSNHTWLKIGGSAEIVVPETRSELVEILADCTESGREYRILGNGSNLLVSDAGIDELVIKTTDISNDVSLADGRVSVGASVAVPQFVNTVVQNDLGGYEYLYSVPGTIGGAIFMNAGRGKTHNKSISDHLVTVDIFDGREVQNLSIENLQFSHRYSTFHEHPEWTILSATFEPPQQPTEDGLERIRERMEKVNRRERSKPNAGSVFKSGTRLPLHRIPPNGLRVGDARFVQSNRICHNGAATCEDVKRLIRRAQRLHKIVPGWEEPEIEWEIWE